MLDKNHKFENKLSVKLPGWQLRRWKYHSVLEENICNWIKLGKMLSRGCIGQNADRRALEEGEEEEEDFLSNSAEEERVNEGPISIGQCVVITTNHQAIVCNAYRHMYISRYMNVYIIYKNFIGFLSCKLCPFYIKNNTLWNYFEQNPSNKIWFYVIIPTWKVYLRLFGYSL